MYSAGRKACLTVVVVVLGLGALVGLEACQFFGKTTEPSEQASEPARRKASGAVEKKAASSEKQPSDQREASPERKAKPSKKTGESPEKPADRPQQAEEPSKRTTSPTSQSGPPSPELTDSFMEDSRITVAVQMKLTGDRNSNFARVDVETDHGVVTLRGVVYSDEDKRRAAELARRIDGVARVDNNLQIEKQVGIAP